MSATATGTSYAGRAFVKMHGLLNHFVIVDVRDDEWRPSAEEVRHVCDIRAGAGADQLILIERSQAADAFMRIFNTDGREAEACGNATRCVAWLLLEEQAAADIALETLAGVLHCQRAGERRVRAEMGRVSMDWKRIPLSQECDTLSLDISQGPLSRPAAVNVGNPHAVFFVESLAAIDVAEWAPLVQVDPLFPEQANVGVAEFIDSGHLRLQVFERGAGMTMACGSGACAAVYAARARGLTRAHSVTVSLPGGDVEIEIRDDQVAIMSGPVAEIFRGRFS